MAESIVRFLGSQVTSKGVIMVFLQDFHPKGLNLGYIQYGSFVEELSALRLVKSRRLISKSEFDSLVANRWVTFFARGSAHKTFGKTSVMDLDTSSYMLSFETAPRACLL